MKLNFRAVVQYQNEKSETMHLPYTSSSILKVKRCYNHKLAILWHEAHELIKLLHEARQCGYNRTHFLLEHEHIDYLLWLHYS